MICIIKNSKNIIIVVLNFDIMKQSFIFLGKCNNLERNLEYFKKWWLEAESNCRHADFQSAALPTELSNQNHFLKV